MQKYTETLTLFSKYSQTEYAEAANMFEANSSEAKRKYHNNKKVLAFLDKLTEIKGKFLEN